MSASWYVQNEGSDAIGPVDTQTMLDGIRSGRVPISSRVCPVGATSWQSLLDVPEFSAVVREVAPPPPRARRSADGNGAPTLQGEVGQAPPNEQGVEEQEDAGGQEVEPEQLVEQGGTPVPATFDEARTTWAREFDEILVLRPHRARAEMEQAIRSTLATFRMAPSNFARTAHMHLSWCWFPIIVAKARFESEWTGAAVPYEYVDKYDHQGHKRREKRRRAPQSFSGSMPSQVYTAFASGDPAAVPHALLAPAASLGNVGAEVRIDQLTAGALYGLPETSSCSSLRTTQAQAANLLSETAHGSEQSRAESELRSVTTGNWEDRHVRVRLRSDQHTFWLVLMPALAGTYAYRGRRWRTVAFASNGYAGCEGAPTSALKVAILVAAVGAAIVAFAYALDIGSVRAWTNGVLGRTAPATATTISPSLEATNAELGGSPAPPSAAASLRAPGTPTRPSPIPSDAGQDAVPMVTLVGGAFLMGSDDGNQDERPRHRAQVSGFHIDATEVTVKAYAACVSAKRCAQPHAPPQGCNWMRQGRDDHPMNCVNWGEATLYCGLFGKRLPTETEWEYAARGPQNRGFAWGGLAPSARLLNGCGAECPPYARSLGLTDFVQTYSGDDGWPGTAPVGSFQQGDTPSGIHDLVGNVWEWTASHYCPYTNRACQATQMVARGSSWEGFQPPWSPVTGRLGLEPGRREIDMGFRCVTGGSPSEASAQVEPEAGTPKDCTNCNGDLMCLMRCQQQTNGAAPSSLPSATPTTSSSSSASFSMPAAKTSLDAIAPGVQACKQVDSDGIDGPAGAGRAVVTFSPNGDVASVNLSAPFSGTPTGNCIAAKFRGSHVPPFAGEPFSVSKSFTIE